jgi:outer membrane immunogenic protein
MPKLLHTTAALSALLATSMAANAAELRARPAPYAPPPPVYAPPPFSWTGFYLGGNIGGAWAHRDVPDTFLGVDFGSGNDRGVFIGGGQLGYNWQIGYAVLGIEADFDGAANNNNTGTVFIPGAGKASALACGGHAIIPRPLVREFRADEGPTSRGR